ncbi:Rho GTPase activation protein [Pseudocohnilembus persalinus]|uniref:Rho GTPase activation protein n=1 Tax=Pseudocohnilembus persalinus TaxID=266149 RepID=A0A0V0QDJ7_PSEPJ|nr:Rho GTPase activation protein [Pseudocohnilembus persalinus]|eukprot:KRX00246.1 Rho GTPase activation protein [Pseudocohnilembus persalinus]
MPEKYHKNLEKMYMVDPSFWTKSYIWWNKKKIFKSKIEYIDNFKQESKSGVLENIQLYKIPEEILKNIGYNQKELQEIKEEEAKKQKELDQNTFEGKEFSELDKDEKDQIPIAFKKLIEFLNEDDQRLKILGIFRKSGFQKELIELENEFFKKNYEYINEEEIDPLVAGGLLKKILHKSKIPLFPFRVNDDILKLIETDRQDQINLCKQIIDKELDEQRRNILQYLMEFLIKVQSYQKQNQMSVYNLAVCFAPCLLRSEQSSMLDIKLTGGYVRLIQIIMENLNYIFGKQDQINESTELLQQVNQQCKEENQEQGNEQNLVQNDSFKQQNQNQNEE